MGRFRRQLFDNYSNYNENTTNNERYNIVYRRVKRIKGFYTHLTVYILVNIFILIPDTNQGIFGNEEFWRWENFSTTLFWGIGLAIHALSVFGKDLFFSVNWEDRKIKEYMEKEANKKWE